MVCKQGGKRVGGNRPAFLCMCAPGGCPVYWVESNAGGAGNEGKAHSFKVADACLIEVPCIHQHRLLGTAATVAAAGGTAAGTGAGTATGCCCCRLCLFQHGMKLMRLDMPGASWQQRPCGIRACVNGAAAAAAAAAIRGY